jgi:hypothetical protein
VHLRGHTNILKRVLLHTAALNLGLLMRTLFGMGTPRSLQGRAAALLASLWCLFQLPEMLWDAIWSMHRPSTSLNDLLGHLENRPLLLTGELCFATGC